MPFKHQLPLIKKLPCLTYLFILILLAILIVGAVYLALTENSTRITLSQLYEVEKERQINLPEIYKTFYSDHYHYRHPNLVGSDLFKDDPTIYEHAIELLAEDGAAPLENNDFVFLMHQGYFFYFLKPTVIQIQSFTVI